MTRELTLNIDFLVIKSIREHQERCKLLSSFGIGILLSSNEEDSLISSTLDISNSDSLDTEYLKLRLSQQQQVYPSTKLKGFYFFSSANSSQFCFLSSALKALKLSSFYILQLTISDDVTLWLQNSVDSTPFQIKFSVTLSQIESFISNSLLIGTPTLEEQYQRLVEAGDRLKKESKCANCDKIRQELDKIINSKKFQIELSNYEKTTTTYKQLLSQCQFIKSTLQPPQPSQKDKDKQKEEEEQQQNMIIEE